MNCLKKSTTANCNFFWKNFTILFLFFFFSCKTGGDPKDDHDVFIFDVVDDAEALELAKGSQRAIQYFDSIFATIKNPGLGDIFHKLSFHRKQYFYSQKNLPRALSCVDSMFTLLEEHKQVKRYEELYITVFAYKGDILMEQKKYREAYKCFFDGKELSAKAGDLLSLSEFSSRLGMVCYKQKDFSRAASYFKKSISEHSTGYKDGYYFSRTQELLDNIGLSYMNLGNSDSALVYFKKTLDFIKDKKHLFKTNPKYIESANAVVYGNIGKLYFQRKEFALGEEMLLKSISINSGEGFDKGDAQNQQSRLAELYIDAMRYDKAENILGTLNKSLTERPNPPIKMLWYDLKSKVYDRTGRKNQALRHYKSFILLRDSLEKQAASFQKIDLDHELENTQNSNKILRLQDLSNQRIVYLLFALGLIILMGIIIFLIWQNNARSVKNFEDLRNLNREIESKHASLVIAFSSLEKSHEDNRQLIKIVAHDLRNPLLSSIKYLDFLGEMGHLNVNQQEVIEILKLNESNSLNLIDELLYENAGSSGLAVETVELHTILQYCVNLMKLKASEKDQIIKLKMEAVNLKVDQEKIWRVMSNLILNGIKFSPRGTIILVNMKRVDDKVLISIRDEGIGIPVAFGNSIFEMFGCSQRQGTAGEESFGMGLSLCKNIIEGYGGRIWYESVENVGSTFFVELSMTLKQQVV